MLCCTIRTSPGPFATGIDVVTPVLIWCGRRNSLIIPNRWSVRRQRTKIPKELFAALPTDTYEGLTPKPSLSAACGRPSVEVHTRDAAIEDDSDVLPDAGLQRAREVLLVTPDNQSQAQFRPRVQQEPVLLADRQFVEYAPGLVLRRLNPGLERDRPGKILGLCWQDITRLWVQPAANDLLRCHGH